MWPNYTLKFYVEYLFAYICNLLCLLVPCEKNKPIISSGKNVHEHLTRAKPGTHLVYFNGRRFYHVYINKDGIEYISQCNVELLSLYILEKLHS